MGKCCKIQVWKALRDLLAWTSKWADQGKAWIEFHIFLIQSETRNKTYKDRDDIVPKYTNTNNIPQSRWAIGIPKFDPQLEPTITSCL
jgi:hypothetical protein